MMAFHALGGYPPKPPASLRSEGASIRCWCFSRLPDHRRPFYARTLAPRRGRDVARRAKSQLTPSGIPTPRPPHEKRKRTNRPSRSSKAIPPALGHFPKGPNAAQSLSWTHLLPFAPRSLFIFLSRRKKSKGVHMVIPKGTGPQNRQPLAQTSQEMLIFAQTNCIFLCVNSFHDWSWSPWRS